jgi:hypothetical protein
MENTLEIWKKIEGYNYSVSDMGRVRNDKTQKILKAGVCNSGYHRVVLSKGGARTQPLVHRLVAIAFVRNVHDKKYVDHIDNNPSNNRVTNLRWATTRENSLNRKLSSKNVCGVKGVHYDKSKSKYRALIHVDGIRIHLGWFSTLEDAKEVRVKRANNEAYGVFVNSCERLEI